MHRISDFFIDRPAVTLLILLVITVGGLHAWKSMPVESDPDVTIPIALVMTVYPGASPDDIEKEVTDPIEKKLRELDDVKEIESYSVDSVSFIMIEFLPGLDIDLKLNELRGKVQDAESELPDDAETPIIEEISTTGLPIMVLALSSEYDLALLRQVAEDLKDAIDAIPAVSQVDVFGISERVVYVEIDPVRLSGYRIPLEAVPQILDAENIDIPAGTVDIGKRRFLLRSMGRARKPGELGDIVLSNYDGRPVHLSDVASVSERFKEPPDTLARVNGIPSINISVVKRVGENTIETSKAIKILIEKMKPNFPKGTEVKIIGDQADMAKKNLRTMGQSVIFGGIFVVICLFLFVGLRNSIIISLAIPLSAFFAFIIMWLKDFSFNNVTMFGLIIVLGILVDDSIIVVENTYRHLEEGKDRRRAAKDGIHEVGGAIIAAGFTTIASFAPILVVSGVMGEFLQYIPYTVIFAMIGAILLAHTAMPMIASRFLRIKGVGNVEERKRTPLLDHAKAGYGVVLRWCLRFRFVFIAIIVIVFIAVVSFIFPLLPVSLFPEVLKGSFFLDVSTQTGSKIQTTDSVVRQVEEIVREYPEVEYYATNVGSEGKQVYFAMSESSGPDYGRVQVEIKDEFKKRGNEIIADMRKRLKTVVGGEVKVEKFMEGPPVGMDVVVRISGEDFGVIRDIANEVQKKLEGIRGTVDIDNTFPEMNPEIQIDIDRDRSSYYGINAARIGMAVRTAFEGMEASKLFLGDEEVDVIVRFAEEYRRDADSIRYIQFPTRQGNLVPFTQVADYKYGSGMSMILRRDYKRTVVVGCNVEGRTPQEVLEEIQADLGGFRLPKGYQFEFGGENEDRESGFGELQIAFLIALMIIFVILVIKFNSIIQSFIVMLAIPFSMVGVIMGLWITGSDFGFMSMMGIVALTGVVVNDSIVLVDYINILRSRGIERNQAIFQGGVTRFRPIIMTSFTTMFAILPLATGLSGGEFFAPMGWAIIFGLMASTVLILLMVPAGYKIVTDAEEWIRRRVKT
ncbi:MAG: efflux RND transporter permease subunit [bacterium]